MINAFQISRVRANRRLLVSLLPFTISLSFCLTPCSMADAAGSATKKSVDEVASVNVKQAASKPAQKNFDLDARINKMRESASNLSLPSTLFEPWWRTMLHDPDSAWLLRNFDIMSSDPDKKWAFPLGSGEYIPRIDIRANADTVNVSAEVPGIDAKNLEVTVTDDSVSIKGEKRGEDIPKRADEIESVERHYGAFERTVSLPCRVASEKAQARLKNGILTIVIPEVQSTVSKGKKLSIQTE